MGTEPASDIRVGVSGVNVTITGNETRDLTGPCQKGRTFQYASVTHRGR